MKLDAKLYRLSTLEGSDKTIQDILDYNFFDYEDSNTNDMFWRNLVNLDRTEYQKKYKEKLDYYLKIIKETKFVLNSPIDLLKHIDTYKIERILNNIKATLNIDFKDTFQYEIKENDLIVIKENDKIVFIGFVIHKTKNEVYGEFRTQSATVGSIGYIYDITNIATNWSLAQYAVGGLDATKIDMPLFQDRFNNKSPFQIINEIYAGDENVGNSGYFFSTKHPSKDKLNSYFYDFDYKKFDDFKSFNTIFPYLKILELYFKEYENGLPFVWAEIEHGEHEVYNKVLASNFELFIPTFKTISDIFDDIIKNSMYNFFLDFDGKLIIRPPLYNYLPLDILELDEENNKWEFKKEHPNYLSSEQIYDYEINFNNEQIKTRSDAKFVWPYTDEINWIPSFYIDIKGLLKYGFRNDQPSTNPNATTDKLATMLASIMNITENSMTRTLNVKVKFEEIDKYKIGELYYIEKINVVGYLLSIERTLKYGEYPETNLIFSYLRNVEDVEVNEKNLVDLLNIYYRYGIFSKFKTRKIDRKEFEKEYDKIIVEFKKEIKYETVKTLKAFKVFPTIMDFIEFTYKDEKVQNQAKKIKPELKQTSETETGVMIENNYMFVRDFKIKFQRYYEFDVFGNNKYKDITYQGKNAKYENLTQPTKSFTPNNIKNIMVKYDNFYKKQKNVLHNDYNYKLYRGPLNIDIYKMGTSFNFTDFPTNLTQKLFNRIVECDSSMKNRFPIYLKQYENGSSYEIQSKNYYYVINTKLNDFSNNFYSILSSYKYFDNNYRYKYMGEIWQLDPEGDYIIHPQFIINFEFLLGNILLDQSKQESKKYVEASKQKSNLFKAHEEGRAIDIVLPKPNTENILILDKRFLKIENKKIKNKVFYKKEYYDWIKDLFIKHFDVVKETEAVFKVFEGDLDIDPFDYEAIIFHLEVNNDEYINIDSELLID
jgi:hypothetical protein